MNITNVREREILLAYSDISDGNMAFKYGAERDVLNNRASFLEKSDVLLESCIAMAILDEDKIVVATSEMKGAGAKEPSTAVEADALITSERGLVLFLFTGDCFPVTYYDPIGKAVALAHLSFKSSRLGLAGKVVERMEKEFATDPAELLIAFGPGIRKDSYVKKIDPEVRALPDWQNYFEDVPSGETKIDLLAYNTEQLLKAGVTPEFIAIDPHDTLLSGHYYSHRRSMETGETEGRFATIIGLK